VRTSVGGAGALYIVLEMLTTCGQALLELRGRRHTGPLLKEKKGTGIFSFRILLSRLRTAFPFGSRMVRGYVILLDGLHATRYASLPSKMALASTHASSDPK